MKSTSFGILSLAVAMTVACGEAQAPAKTAPAAAPAATQAPVAAAPAAAAAPEFGVAECDDYLAKYVACVDSKVPEAARAALRQSLDQTKAQWKQAASTPEGKNGLAMACKQMTETAKTSMTAYGCSF
ncbi:MAG: hypothetical protein K1Y01_16980 [Vicinamibacteria bacterium]|nr:hypothetical protein [Vicinamibacteria bacterium]